MATRSRGTALTHLRYFDEIVRAGSIRLAAERLRITPSAISRQMRVIEDSVGALLFERHARGMVLTSAGELYARYSRSALLDEDRIYAEVDDLKGLRRGHIRICSAEGVLDCVVAEIARFRLKYPAVSFELSVVGSQSILPLVRGGDADIGVTYNADMEEGIRYISRQRAPVFAVLHPEHPLAEERRLSFGGLSHFPLAFPGGKLGLRRLLDSQCRISGLVVSPALETNSIDAMVGFVRSGAGVAFLPISSVAREVRLGSVVAVSMRDREMQKGTVDLCVLAGRTLPSGILTFIGSLQQALVKSGELSSYNAD